MKCVARSAVFLLAACVAEEPYALSTLVCLQLDDGITGAADSVFLRVAPEGTERELAVDRGWEGNGDVAVSLAWEEARTGPVTLTARARSAGQIIGEGCATWDVEAPPLDSFGQFVLLCLAAPPHTPDPCGAPAPCPGPQPFSCPTATD